MLLSQKQTIEDYIIESLSVSSQQTGPELLSSIQKIRGNTTKQAMYAVLKPLLKNEIIAKVGQKYFISDLWTQKISKLLHIGNTQRESIFDLQNGESVSYSFPSLLSCDTYWAHIFNVLLKWVPRNKGVFIWNPHEWFFIGRMKEEKEILQTLKKQGKFTFLSISGNTELDKEFKKIMSDDVFKININADFNFKQHYYLNIFDDYIIEVFLNKKLTEKIEKFYQKYTTLNKENILFFENLIKEKYNIRMKISRKSKKAHLLRKKLSRDFYIPSSIEI